MNIVYLGFLKDVFNWIFDKILSPIIEFIGNLLGTVLSWLFEYILAPILMNVLWPLVEMVIELIIDILGEIFYSLLAMFLELIDIMELMFDIFAGLEPVYMDGVEYTLLEAIFRLDAVQTAMWTLIFIGILLTIFFSILAVIRSMGDINEVARPVSRVITATLTALFRLITIPAMGLFMILLATALLTTIDLAFQSINPDGEDASLAAMVFVVSSLEAAQNSDYNASTASSSVSVGISDSIRKPFYIGTKDYTNVDVVGNYFNYGDFDYLLGYGGCIFLFLILIVAGFNFIQRIFEVLVLLIVAPFFASVMPLDDGEKMKAWQELFIGKLFTGYGTVIAMQLYLIIAPIVMSGTISFGEGSVAADYIIRLVFMMGGAYSVLKIGPSITQLLSVQAGQSEQASSQMMMNTTMMTARSAKMQVKKATNKIKQRSQERKNKTEERYKELQNGSSGGGGGGGRSKPRITDGNLLPKEQRQKASKTAARDDIKIPGRVGLFTDDKGKKRLGLNMGKVLTRGRKADGTRVTRIAGMGVNRVPDGKGGTKVSKVRLPGMSLKRDANGKMKVGSVGLGPLKFKRGASVTKNADGSVSQNLGKFGCSKFFGLKTKRDAEGNVQSRTGGLNFGPVKFKADENGKVRLNELNLGVAKMSRAEKVVVGSDGSRETLETGGMFCSKAIGGVHRSYDWNSGQSQTDKALGVNIVHDHSGDISYTMGMALNKMQAKDYEAERAADIKEIKTGVRPSTEKPQFGPAPNPAPPQPKMPAKMSKVGGQLRRPPRAHAAGGGGPKGAAANRAYGAAQKAAAKQAAAAKQNGKPNSQSPAAKATPPTQKPTAGKPTTSTQKPTAPKAAPSAQKPTAPKAAPPTQTPTAPKAAPPTQKPTAPKAAPPTQTPTAPKAAPPTQTPTAPKAATPTQKPTDAKITPPAQKSTPMQNTSKARQGPPSHNPNNRNRRRKK